MKFMYFFLDFEALSIRTKGAQTKGTQTKHRGETFL